MSKGLKALKRLVDTMPFAFIETKSMREIEIIEKELKEKDELAQALSIVTCENGDLLKYKKALEIIKNKYNNGEGKSAYLLISHCYNLTEEEYALLKEVLL